MLTKCYNVVPLLPGPYIVWYRIRVGEQGETGRAARPAPMGHAAVAMVTLIWCSTGGSEM